MHFAQIENGIVTRVIVAEQDVVDAFGGTWVQTSYNTHGGVHRLGGTPLRKNYAGVGYIYDSVRDAFYQPQPSNLHELDEDTCLWKLKEEFMPMAMVRLVSQSATLPSVMPDTAIELEGQSLSAGALVLFTSVPTPGIYSFSEVTGEFVINETPINAVQVVGGAVNDVWTKVSDVWTQQTVA